MDSFQEALSFRHACKEFDGRKIGEEDLISILEAGRLSPSSFGMEPWRFLVIEDPEVKADLRPLCWDQKQITSCSHLIVIKNQIALVQEEDYIERVFRRRGLDEERTRAYIERYKSFLKGQNIPEWTAKQCYIALESMLLAAAFRKIDSCPIEGFEREKVEEYLGLDRKREGVAVIATFGYRKNPQPPKRRFSLAELVERI
ncbi:MAG: NAD(P)H-dependent oxidoreductase [Epsilonproteobacteria bacterium]|nr:NAD(P)H-dependent oxidoreductase [Campylobacterota bacterium]NPA57474.1 NAD(P)H-dependent oxidoreductase [Campylobacterota bacterium]